MSTASDRGPSSSVVLRIERVHDGQTMIVRTLSEEYGGLMSHGFFVKRKWVSEYCDPETCCVGKVRGPRQWYGYCAALWWREEVKVWQPIALEITEALELDFRDVYKRGQLWELFRPAKMKDKVFPTTGRLVRQDAPESFPPAFAVQPALYSVYRAANIPLDVPNPHPKRVKLPADAAGAPELPKVSLEELEKRRRNEERYRLQQEQDRKRA